jgi:hypothetical protein
MLQVVRPLLLCMAGRNAAGQLDESVAASQAARVNASAVMLELCKVGRDAVWCGVKGCGVMLTCSCLLPPMCA